MEVNTLGDLFRESVVENGSKPALGFVGETVLSYEEVGLKVKAVSAFIHRKGIRKGDKVALLATNQPNWGVAYFALVTMGVVVVPILPDFHENEIENIVKHSESKALFVSKNMLSKLKSGIVDLLKFAVVIDDFSAIVKEEYGKCTEKKEDVIEWSSYPFGNVEIDKDDIASIIYTSGTTGKSKGVMLSHWNLTSNVLGSRTLHHVKNTDRFLSLLPLSHTLENTVGFLLPFYYGASVFYMRKLPTPSVLLPALRKVQPTVILSVPLIMEKIYRGKVLPGINSKIITRLLYKVKATRILLNEVAGRKLMQTFGGKVEFFGIGGAKLDPSVEQFMIEAKFPYAIGYGLTETSPLVAGFDAFRGRFQSTGKPMAGVQVRINEPRPESGEGEIWVKGDNVMKGYYKEPEMTKEVLTDDGWFRTGDLGLFDEDGFLSIRGRLKNMILGSSGENIYPEEIEAIINKFKHVQESIVIQKKGRLVAMVHFNREELEAKFMHMKGRAEQFVDQYIDELVAELQLFVNERVNRFSRIQMVVAHSKPFEKTATKKIKRFLYY